MRAVFVLPLLMPLSLAVPALAETPHEAFLRQLREESRQKQARRYDHYRPSDVAECRSRGNAVFGGIVAKQRVMDDCLEARRLRRQGR